MMNHYDDSTTIPPTPPAPDITTMTTTSEAARLLGYASTKGISQRIQRGRIPGAVKQDGVWLVPVAWVREQQQAVPQIPHKARTTVKAEEPSSPSSHLPLPPNPDPVLVPPVSPDSKGVASPDKQEGVAIVPPSSPPTPSAPLTPMQLYVHSLVRLVDKLETLRAVRQRIGNAVYERQRQHDGYYFPQPDETCSTYLCNWRGSCIFYRSKGCPSYDEATRADYKHAVGKVFYEEYEHKLPLLEYPPCLCHPE